MGFFIREKKDGTRAAGYGVYLLGGLFAVGGVMFLHHRLTAGTSTARAQRSSPSNVSPVTLPAAAVARIDVKGPPKRDPATQSQRLPSKRDSAERTSADARDADSFNPIQLALQRAKLPTTAQSSDHAPIDEAGARDAQAVFTELPPAFPTDANGQANGAAPGAQLFGYRDTGDSGARIARLHVAEPTKFFAPKGTLICVYLLTTVDTGNPSVIIQFGAAKPLVFNHRLQLPFGTRFLGKLSGQPARNRVNLAVDTVLYPDGLELPISATAVEADERGSNIYPGVAAYYIPPPQWAQIAPYVADFISGYLSLLQARAEQPFAAQIGNVSIRTTDPTDARPPLYQASAQAIQDFTQARLKDLEQRYATAYLVPAGTTCWLQLERDLDLSRAHTPSRVVTPDFISAPGRLAASGPEAPTAALPAHGRDLPLSPLKSPAEAQAPPQTVNRDPTK